MGVMDKAEADAMDETFARWLALSADLTEGDKRLAKLVWESAWWECRRYPRPHEERGAPEEER